MISATTLASPNQRSTASNLMAQDGNTAIKIQEAGASHDGNIDEVHH